MKKIPILLGLMALICAGSVPRLAACDKDVGKVRLQAVFDYAQPADEIQAVVTTPEITYMVEVRDPGSMPVPSFTKAMEGEAKSPAVNCALSEGDVTINESFSIDRQCAYLKVVNRLKGTKRVLSNSCGGIGY